MNTPSTNSKLDALVIGGGPVGLAMAGDLAYHGVKCRIIDKALQPTTLSKAVVVMPHMLEEFDLRGMADEFLARGQRMNSFSIFAEGKLVARTRYDRLRTRYNHLVCLPQTETEAILTSRARKLGVEVEWGVELVEFKDEKNGVWIQLKHSDGRLEELVVPYLVGCDGAHSIVRHTLNVPFEGAQYSDCWMLGDVETAWDYPRDEGISYLDKEGYMAVFPMPGGRSRIFCVFQLDTEIPEEVKIETLESVADRWARCALKISNPKWLAKFHVHHRKVKYYSRGRVFMAGDAAHLHSPESGLGMNTGIQDAYNLAWKLALVCKGQAPESLLDTFDPERNLVGKEVVKYSDAIHTLSAQFSPVMEAVRNRTFQLFAEFTRLHFTTVEKTVQLGIHYPESAIVQSLAGRQHHILAVDESPNAGERARDSEVLDVSKRQWVRLYEIMRAPCSHLLLFSGMNPSRQAWDQMRAVAAVGERYAKVMKTIHIVGADNARELDGTHGVIYKDYPLRAHELYAAERPRLYFIRPDGYVGLKSDSLDAASIEKFCRSNFTV